jgi:hypothetical protein
LKKVDLSKSREHTATQKDHPIYHTINTALEFVISEVLSGQAADTRTDAQKQSMRDLVMRLKQEYPIVEVLGHRDTSPDLNDNGIVESSEWIKMCPCFDAATEFGYSPTVLIRP